MYGYVGVGVYECVHMCVFVSMRVRVCIYFDVCT